MADNVIGIKFGVAGEGSISGESGKLIKSQLEQIAKAVNLQVKVNINKTHFKKQINDLKSQLSEALGNLNVNIGTPGGRKAGAPGGGNVGSNASNTEKLDFNTLKSSLDKLYKIKQQAETAFKKGQVNTAAELANTADGLDASYNQQLMRARELGVINDEQFKQLIEQEQALIRMHTARTKDADAIARQREEQEKLAQAQKAAKTVEGQQSAWNGLYANAERLLQREDYLIQNNKKAAESAEKLRKAMAAGFDPTKPEQSAQNVKNLRTALKEVDAELAKIGTEADTFGFKIKKAFKTKVVQNLAYALLALVGNASRQVYNNVLELDKAVTDLQIATGGTREETKELVKDYAKLAQELGATVTQVTAAADTWLRQGYEVAEVNTLIKNTLMLSKLGQLDSSEAAKALTSAMKGYNVSVEESIKIVDKFTAVDMEAAVSAGDIATAMSETAVSAESAGVSMDRLIGYIATVSEVTQDGAESVGTFYKTMFARMSNIKAGRFVDDETGESLNDVASVLNEVGVSLFDTEGQFRSFEDVLDEVGEKWNDLNKTEKAAIATAMAGTRQQEKFRVLMENYSSAMNFSEVAANSSGTATAKYNSAYMESIEAKLESLKAKWQEFSQNLLDSELVKFFVDALSGIVDIFNGVIGNLDTIAMLIPIIGVLITIHIVDKFKDVKKGVVGVNKTFSEFFKKTKKGFKTFVKEGGLAELIATIASLGVNWLSTSESVSGGVATIIVAIGLLATAITIAILKAATSFKALKSIPIIAIITVALSAIMALISGINILANADKNALKAAKEYAKERQEAVQETIEKTEELKGLTEEYIDLIGNKTNFLDLDKSTRERILEIQAEINTAVSDEQKGIDLINGNLQEKSGLLDEILRKQEESALKDAQSSYQAQKSAMSASFDKNGKFIPTKTIDDIEGWGWDLWDGNVVFERGTDAAEHADQIAAVFGKQKTLTGYASGNLFDDKWEIGIDEGSDLTQVAKDWKAALDKVKADGLIVTSQDQRLYDMLYAYYQEEILPLVEGVDDAALQVGQAQLPLLAREAAAKFDPQENIEGFEKELVTQMTAAMADYGLSEEQISSLVKTYLLSNYYDEYTQGTAGEIKYSFDTILEAVSEGYDALKSAIEDMDELGIISGDTIKDIIENYPELLKYLELTEEGYKVAEGAMDSFLAAMKEKYGIGENESTWNAVIATLFASDEIETWIEEQEKIKEAYEGQLDKQKELIDIRKDLLKTYKEEVKYQEQLAQKQRAVADLRTKLALARLDTSAAGKARVRELEKELEESEDELDDFTLENAIEKITQQMEDGYSEYEKFIQKQIDRIETAINNAAGNYKNGNVVEVPEHHTGGFVGGVELQSNEEFAKLMKGEFVVTPAQMSRFMGETLPTMVGGGTGGEVNYNAPLITIKCDSITKETVPEVEKIVNEAVNKIKTEIDSAFSRTGFKKKI